MGTLSKRQVILGVSGSISAYKAPLIARLLKKKNIDVIPVLTSHAEHFVTSLTMATVCEQEGLDDISVFSPKIPHLSIERESDVLIVAPATANSIAKFAWGIADDALSSVFLSFQGPKIIVPAMHTEMWDNPQTIDNIDSLKAKGVMVLGPDEGELACGDVGRGRMVEPELIALATEMTLLGLSDLSGKKVLITAGGTREAIDNMRVISNRSTGALGEMLAHAASFAGAEVELITSADRLIPNPRLHAVHHVSSVRDMKDALERRIDWADTLFMAAAVSDFTVESRDTKIKRQDSLTLELTPTPDLLKSISSKKGSKRFIGFCLEDSDLLNVAKAKLDRKGVDVIVANTSDAVGASKRTVHIVRRDTDHVETWRDLSVVELASKLISV